MKISKEVSLLLSILLVALQRTRCGRNALLKCLCNGEDQHYLLYLCTSSGLSKRWSVVGSPVSGDRGGFVGSGGC